LTDKPVVDQETCQHSIKWGITCGYCTKCKKGFELDLALQPSEAELCVSQGISPYAHYEGDDY